MPKNGANLGANSFSAMMREVCEEEVVHLVIVDLNMLMVGLKMTLSRLETLEKLRFRHL